MLNLPYEFYDYLEHSVEEWVYDYSLADSIPDGTGQDESMDLLAAAVPVRVVEWSPETDPYGWLEIVCYGSGVQCHFQSDHV